jgi:hypothetical protein
VKDVIGDIDRPLDKPVRYLVPHPATWRNYQCCPWAKTVIAVDPETEKLVACPVTCKRWGCPYCAVRKIRKLAFLTNGAAPNRWTRLGVQPLNYASPREAWEKTSPAVPELFRQLNATLGNRTDYLRVTELHQSGFPHYHALLRGPFLPIKIVSRKWASLTALPYPKPAPTAAMIKDLGNRGYDVTKLEAAQGDEKTPPEKLRNEWNNATGAPYVWLAKINDSFSSFRYLVKYLTKLHKIEWTDRHVSYSRNFFREEDKEKLAFPERTIVERTDEHPWVWLANRYDRNDVGVDDNGCYHLPEEFCGTPGMWTRKDCGLPPMKETTEPPPPKHVQRTAFETTDARGYEDVSF